VYLSSVQPLEGQCLSETYCPCLVCDGILVEDVARPALITDHQDTHVLSTPLYVAETWTVRAEDARILESLHMKCHRQTLGIRSWQDRVRNVDVANQTGLPPVMDHIVKYRNFIFGRIARMPCTVPVHQALRARQIMETSFRSTCETLVG